jgi:hypothetical protein
VQRYWLLDDSQRRTGFESFYQINDDSYRLAHSFLSGSRLSGLMELQFSRQS